MSPGRELDALIAEKVMGLQVLSEGHSEIGPVYITEPNENGFTGERTVHFYSTSIEAAWQVVEKLTEDSKNHFQIKRAQAYPIPGLRYQGLDGPPHPQAYAAYFGCYNSEDGLRNLESKADSAPHAICLAALKAVGAPMFLGGKNATAK